MVCIWGSLVKFQRGGVVVKTMVCARVRIERGGGGVGLGVMVLHRHKAIFRFAFGIAYLNSRGVGLFLMLFLMCFCTVMQFVCTVCMQAITHSVDNVPSQHAVKLVVVGLGFC